MKIQYHPLTTSDLNNAVAYYNRQQAGLGDELRTEVYKSIERILASPAQFSVVSKDIRAVSSTVSHTQSCSASRTQTLCECLISGITAAIQALVLAAARGVHHN